MSFNRARIRLSLAATLAAFAVALSARAQPYTYASGYAPAPPVVPDTAYATLAYSPDQLDQMLAPIALYPDPLLSEILAAATYPQDVAAAGQWLQYNRAPYEADIQNQPWDSSVKAIAHVPNVVFMMAGNMAWTEALGSAFASQQAQVMDSVQRLRARALAAHTLISTPQQEVVQDDGAIEILPAQPDVIYVPEYDPDVVYAAPLIAGPFFTFGPACPFGDFFDLDFDFPHHRFLRGAHFDRDRHRFDFGRAQPWARDPHRPIPHGGREFVAPRGVEDQGRTPGAFNPALRRPEDSRQPAGNERPVNGMPGARPNEQQRNAPQRSTPPTPAVQPRAVPVPARTPTPAPPTPRPNERSVNGMPARSAPPPQPTAPPPAQHSAPAPAPSPAFHPSGGGAAASERGHSSMRR